MEVKDTEIIDKATEFENRKHVYKSTNEIYKESKDSDIMDMMKRLTVIKRKVEKRLKGRPGS